jgi:hypothetical protein
MGLRKRYYQILPLKIVELGNVRSCFSLVLDPYWSQIIRNNSMSQALGKVTVLCSSVVKSSLPNIPQRILTEPSKETSIRLVIGTPTEVLLDTFRALETVTDFLVFGIKALL